MNMRLNVDILHQKSIDEIREIFSTIPSTENCIYLQGHFHVGLFDNADTPKALAYLPKNISQVFFEIEYNYEEGSSSYSSPTDNPTNPWNSGIRLGSSGSYYHPVTKEIGNKLKDYIALLPQSVCSMHLCFIDKGKDADDKTYAQYIADILSSIPPSISRLDVNDWLYSVTKEKMSSLLFNVFCKLLKKIPDSVRTLKIMLLYKGMYKNTNGNMDKSTDFNENYKTLIASINSNITELSLPNSELYRLPTNCFDTFFKNLPEHLEILDLCSNELNKKSVDDLCFFLSKLTLSIRKLGLSDNNLSILGMKSVAFMLSKLPATLIELDIGENGLTLLKVEDFAALLEGLSKTITTLRICEKNTTQPAKDLAERLCHMPPHVKIVSFSDSNLSRYSINVFADVVLASLPETVEGIDLSSNNLAQKSVDDLVYLFSHLPRHIRILRLRDNHLGTMKMNDLRIVLAALPQWISELDISWNGLDKLPSYTQIRSAQNYIPDTVKCLITNGKEFVLRNDGAIVPLTSLHEVSLFRPQKQFHHLSAFANLRVVMMQIIEARNLNIDIALHILAYVIDGHPAEFRRINYVLSTTIISSIPPEKITITDQYQCISVIKNRIENPVLHDNCLDLSRCGLNRLEDAEIQNQFSDQMGNLPALTTMNLRGNGFLHNDRCKNVFIELMKKIPKGITCLDLSDNGFEHKTAEELAKLFSYLPAMVDSIILDHEQPVSPALHVARRQWPDRYRTLTADAQNRLQQAHILLNDYTKNDSTFSRFVSLRWDRHCIEDAVRLAYRIEKKLITSMEDFNYEAEQIKLTDEKGALAMRFSFLAYHPSMTEKKQIAEQELGDGFELKTSALATKNHEI